MLALASHRAAELVGASTVKVLLNWDDKSAEALINASSRSTSEVNLTGWSKGMDVTAGGEGVVSHLGLALLRQLADKTGLTGRLSRALASPRLLIHDRGRVASDLACAIADGSEVTSDFRVLADQKELFGLAASVPTTWPTHDEIAAGGPGALARITKAVNGARRQAWAAIEAAAEVPAAADGDHGWGRGQPRADHPP